ncbi:hypothetical protein [Vibrio algarum]|uniref:Alginate export domain-containing protein n=1 Tax=Vibrio algarum TaxID=3020714 RepID=A0ABT4YWC3_9VIBR|nr:hypothetical protein [Vibrio sp. KJ40-1]MDB1125887.1 hypothetical protein [Vibrio sp. KJ40-1]
MNRLRLYIGLLLLLLPIFSHAAIPGLQPAKAWDLNGYVKYMGTGTLPDSGEFLFDNLIHQRFNFEYRFNSSLRFNVGMRNRFMWGDSAENPYYADYIELDTGYFDLSKNWSFGGHNADDSYVGNSQFDRLYIDWTKADWQFTGGRFRINWGMTTIWNPNDVFNSYSVYDFDYEERPGTDAVLLSKKLGYASNFDVVYSPNKQNQLNSYAARYLFNVAQWDAQVLMGKARLDHFIGTGIAGDIKGAGLRAEISYFDPTEKVWQGVEQAGATISSIEMDYSFAGVGNWMIKGALLHNSNPQEPINATAFLRLPLTAKTLSFTEFTSYLDASFDLSALSRITLSNIYYQDGSCFLGLSNNYSLSNNWQLLGVVQYFAGESDSLFSESSSTLIFAQVKWSF